MDGLICCALVGLFAAGLLNMKHCAENPLLGWHFVEEKRSPFKVALKRSSRAHQEQRIKLLQQTMSLLPHQTAEV